MGVSVHPLRVALLLFSLLGTLAAAPKLRLATSTVGPVSIAAGANGPSQTVEAYNDGDGALNLRVSASAPWIVPTVGSPTGCRTVGRLTCIPIRIALQTSALARGMSTGVVTVSDPNAVDAPQTITVAAQIGGGVPDRIDLFVAPDGSSARATLSANTYVPIRTTTQDGRRWLAVAADGVGSYRFGITYFVTATHLSGMAEGDYRGSLTVSNSPFAADNKTVPVSLRVTSQPIAEPQSPRVKFRIAQNTPKQTQFLVVANRGLGALNISSITATTSSGGTWLAVDKREEATAITADPTGLAAGTYQGSLSVASNAVNGTLAIPAELEVVPQAPPLAFFRGTVSNATFNPEDSVAPGDIMAVFGEQFAYEGPELAGSVPLAAMLGQTRVLVNGRPTPLYYKSYGQVNFQLPFDTPPGDALVRVERDGQPGNMVSVKVIERAPHILQLGEYGLVRNQDGTFPMPVTPGLASRPARPGDVLVIYATGLGATNPPVATGEAAPLDPLARLPVPLKVFFGQRLVGAAVPAEPEFVGLTPTFVSLYQINVTVPEDAPHGLRVPMYLDLGTGGRISNQVLIAIE